MKLNWKHLVVGTIITIVAIFLAYHFDQLWLISIIMLGFFYMVTFSIIQMAGPPPRGGIVNDPTVAMMHLSDLGVPKDDGKGNTYSLVGRIDKAISHPTNDAKAMIAEGLEYHNMNNKKAPTPMWEPVLIGNIVREIDDKCQELSIHAVLDALLEVCKSNEQEGEGEES